MFLKIIITTILSLLVSSCCHGSRLVKIKGKEFVNIKEVRYHDLQDWSNSQNRNALLAFTHSCDKIAVMNSDREIGNKIGYITAKDFRNVCDMANVVLGMENKEIRNFFEDWFVPFRVESKNGDKKGKFTGYYIPTIEGSLQKDEIYKYPVYKNPLEVVENYKNFSRKNIETGEEFADKNLELLYVKSKVDLFFLQIQGSGRIKTPQNTIIRINFDGKNSYPYTSIMSYMIENDILGSGKQNPSYQELKNWLESNPGKADKIMHLNESFVFFKIGQNEFVTGSSLTPLIPEVSLAIDHNIMPYGFPIWLQSYYKKQDYNKLLISQDTGSNINGAIRGDVFFGYDDDAKNGAINMNSEGSYYIFLPRNIAKRLKEKLGNWIDYF
jgi:membrane-bound lytic murein transglycosylase A